MSSHDLHNLPDQIYRSRCSSLEKKIKEMVFLNAAYENEVHSMQIKLARERADRNILLKKLSSYEKCSINDTYKFSTSGNNNNTSSSCTAVSSIEENNKILSSMLSKKHSVSSTSSSGKVPPVPTLASLNVSSGKKKKSTTEATN